MALNPYNPKYNPLVDATSGEGDNYAPTYWMENASIEEDDGTLTNDIEADVAIIGSGFTGLCTALFLAREYNIKSVVLEANQVAWGCSSRNGGQAQLSVGRLTRDQGLKNGA